ncbi:MAG TPA: EutN/CcmL family microcompartment protein [bacterium]|nr:EutN/CcmL family microcompartment protein [bacterium]
MNIGLVIGNVVSTIKHEAYENRTMLLVQPLDLDGKPKGLATIAVDYVGAGTGDVVLLGAAPGLAPKVLNLKVCPVRELIMGIIDSTDVATGETSA